MDPSGAAANRVPYGVLVGNRIDDEPHESLATAILADHLGYREIWLSELAGYDAFVAALAVCRPSAAEHEICASDDPVRHTAALAIGPLPAAVRDPVTAARGAASLAGLTGREISLVLGASSSGIVSGWHGRSRHDPAASLAESVRVLRDLTAGKPVDFDGDFVHSCGFRSTLPPSRAVVTAVAFGQDTLDAVVGHADRIAVPLASVEFAARLHARLGYAADRLQRPTPTLSVWIPTAVDPDTAAERGLRQLLAPYLRAGEFGRMFTEAGFGSTVALARTGAHPRSLLPQMTDALVATVAAVGGVEEVRAALAEYRAVGVDEVVLVPVRTGDPLGARSLRALAAPAG